jgi:hypothetical protein
MSAMDTGLGQLLLFILLKLDGIKMKIKMKESQSESLLKYKTWGTAGIDRSKTFQKGVPGYFLLLFFKFT